MIVSCGYEVRERRIDQDNSRIGENFYPSPTLLKLLTVLCTTTRVEFHQHTDLLI